MQYNPGNYEKYMTKNPLKRKMVDRLNAKIIKYVAELCRNAATSGKKVSILDAGCGEGFVSDLLYRNIDNICVTGLEYTEEALAIASQINNDIHFMKGDIYQMPFGERSFDIVLCTEVLEHLENPEMALRELARVARYAVFLTVPNEPWFCLGNLLALKNISRLGNPVDHINHWSYRKFVRYTATVLNGEQRSTGSFPWTIVICRK